MGENKAYLSGDNFDYSQNWNKNRNLTNVVDNFNEASLAVTYEYKKVKGDNVLESSKNYIKKYYKPSRSCLTNYLFKRVPFFDWIRTYKIKEDFVKDLAAGLAVGVVHIPQYNFKMLIVSFILCS